MALLSSPVAPTTVLVTLLLLLRGGSASCELSSPGECDHKTLPQSDIALLEFPLNLEYLEAEFFSWGALGRGLDSFEPELAMGGPPPIGGQKAKLSPVVRDVIAQFAYQEFGHVRAIQETVKGFPRPLLNISETALATVMNDAFGKPLVPPFNAYANDINYLLASYVIPYVGLTGYVGTNPNLICPISKKLLAGLLGIEGGQDAVIRTLLYERAFKEVKPYGITVAEFTNRISNLRNELGREGAKDEGLIVDLPLGAEGRIAGNVLAGNESSLSYPRTPEEVIRIVYGTGKENEPGLFYPKGAKGRIAESYLQIK